jgi:hypothetical protein
VANSHEKNRLEFDRQSQEKQANERAWSANRIVDLSYKLAF